MKDNNENSIYREIDGVKGGCGHSTEEVIGSANSVMILFVITAVIGIATAIIEVLK